MHGLSRATEEPNHRQPTMQPARSPCQDPASQDPLSSAEGGSLPARGPCSDQPSTHVQTACRKAPSQPEVCAVTRVVKLSVPITITVNPLYLAPIIFRVFMP